MSTPQQFPKLSAPATEEAVSKKYQESGLKAGWSLFAVPQERLLTAEYAIIGLNPAGGGEHDSYHYGEHWHSPDGNAYDLERWGSDGKTRSPIQVQVLAWHALIGIKPDESLCAMFCPFRTKDETNLRAVRGDLIGFSLSLWKAMVPHSSAHTFIAMGKTAGDAFISILRAKPVAELSCDWGSVKIRIAISPDGKRVVTMPHPSRFKLFGGEPDAYTLRARHFRNAISWAI